MKTLRQRELELSACPLMEVLLARRATLIANRATIKASEWIFAEAALRDIKALLNGRK